jgi:integrase
MPAINSSRVPSYRKHKATGQAVVTLNGKDHYLGQHGTKASKTAYDRLISEWIAGGRALPADNEELSVSELIVLYWRHAQQHYRKPDGTRTSEQTILKAAMRPLKRLYGTTPAARFGPLALQAVRQQYVEDGVSRGTANAYTDRVKRLFKWAVAKELVPAGVFHGLQAVAGLQKGRSDARETEPVKPVPEAYIEAVRPHVHPSVAAMIDVQRLTGCRPGEVCKLRACDIDMTGRIWVFRPADHKTQWRGRQREIYIGPRAQEVIRPFLKTDLQGYLSRPSTG